MLGEKVVRASVSKHLSYIRLTSAVLLTSIYFYIELLCIVALSGGGGWVGAVCALLV